MDKLNKVIAGLECCQSDDKSCQNDCPYFIDYELNGCMDELLADALEVLKNEG